jgi:polar amino acid transport system substrate-binding protein
LKTRTLSVLGLVALVAVAAACASSHAAPGGDVLAGLDQTTTSTAPPSNGPPVICNTGSYRPQGALPAPGHMPAGTFMQQIQARGRLIAGVDQNTLLFGSRNPVTNQIEGFDIDMLHQVANAIFGDPNRIEYRAITSAERIPAVRDGSVDIVAETMTINCERWQQVDFTTEYYRAGQKVLVRTDSTAQSIDDLGGKKVCAAAGSTSINNFASRPTHPVPFIVADWTDCLVALQQGTVDAISTDDTILYGLKAQDPYTKVIGDRFTEEPYGMAINQSHPEFVRFVNSVFDQMRGPSGTWGAIWAHWLGPVLNTPPPAMPAAAYRD